MLLIGATPLPAVSLLFQTRRETVSGRAPLPEGRFEAHTKNVCIRVDAGTSLDALALESASCIEVVGFLDNARAAKLHKFRVRG